MSSGKEPEKPKKPWKEYTINDLKSYTLRNFDKSDCSFVINNRTQNKDSKRELRSFKWMLCDFSPLLKGILTYEKNKAINFKMIPVPDEDFEALLSFVHTKTLRYGSFNKLLDLYETSKKYDSVVLRDAIMKKLEEKNPVGNWMRFAAIAWREDQTNPKLKEIFQRIKGKDGQWKKTFECELTTNLETFLHFEFCFFTHFLGALSDLDVNPLICFKTVEVYVVKNIFEGRTVKIEEEDNLNIDRAIGLFDYVNFEKMTIEDFNNGPAKSAVLDEELKVSYKFRTLSASEFQT